MTDATPAVLVLTPVKDASAFLEGYAERLLALDYPPERLSVGLLEGDSADDTAERAAEAVARLGARFARAGLWRRDFGARFPSVFPRWWGGIQKTRRAALARARNRLLFEALGSEAWVLWLDVDVIEYPADVLRRLLATGERIVQPNCVLDYGGPSFDRNAWAGRRKRYLSDLRGQGDLVRLDGVGGTMLLVHADLHREGLVFPPFPYRPSTPMRLPRNMLAMETEGLALMARDMGVACWGMPGLEIRHHRG
ncbi:MAG: hypothetical protein ACFBSD_16570 [Paracoccaceae bacterium]